jgi:hypothetical protein
MIFAIPALLLSLGSIVAAQPEPTCTRSQECRQMALDAASREDFEAFHSLAWRAVQTGKPNDAELMFLLARAQSLSGRPDDALVMLGRLADRGIAHPEVETLDDFTRVRDMAGWPNLLEKMRAVRSAPLPATPAPTARPAALAKKAMASPAPPAAPPVASDKPSATTPTKAAAKPPVTPSGPALPTVVPIASVIAVPPTIASPVAMAYDKVSARMIIADDSSGTLKVLSELSGNAMDLVSAGWGGGYHTNALVIDSKRGDLWVVGTRNSGAPESVVHRVQLISGRLLYSVPRPDDSGATRFAAVALSDATVFVLDAEGGRIFELDRGDKTLRVRASMTERDLTGLAMASDSVAYVAHAGGILRIDLAAKRSEDVKASAGIALDGIEWIDYVNNSLVAVQRRPDGAMAAVRLRVDRRGRTVTAVDSFGAAAAKGAALLGDTLYFVSASPEGPSVARVQITR